MDRTSGRIARRCAAGAVALALLAPLQSFAGDTGPDAPTGRAAVDAPRRATADLAVTADLTTPAAAPPSAAAAGGAPALVTEPDVVPTASAPSPPPPAPAHTFAERFPAQALAASDPDDPAADRWALLIGINEHLGRVSDNIGSRQDAEDLRAHLLARGWRDDHILLLTDRVATRANIVDGLRWLADKTGPSSMAVFHYSGHSKKWYGQDVDGDGEVTDEGLWPTDDRFIVDSELVSLLAPVDARAAWFSFATCNAAGFADHGLARPGRVLTFSSGEPQKSYEHPWWENSVWGWLMIDQGLRAGRADLDGDGRVSVEESWTWARPHARSTTRQQRHGAQDAVIVDDLPGQLVLDVPGAPPAPAAGESGAPEQPSTAPPPDEPAPAPQPPPEDPDRHGGYLCLLCGDG